MHSIIRKDIHKYSNSNQLITNVIPINHNSTGVTSGVTLVKKIELEIEHNVDKMEHSTKN